MVPYDQPEAALVHFFRCCKLAERGVLTGGWLFSGLVHKMGYGYPFVA